LDECWSRLSESYFSHKIGGEFFSGVQIKMIFDGKIDLDVPVDKAWDFLIDINKFSACLPGIEEVKQIDDKTFEGALAAAVGPISGKFTFRATIVESRPPDQMVVRTEGTDSVTKSIVNTDMTVDLRKLSDTKTQMDYKADVKIKGRLAILGDMVLRATATLILQEFTRRLHKGLGDYAAV
jgi:uncharacterized protein